MNRKGLSFVLSILLVCVNISFLYAIVATPHLLAKNIMPGLNIGILGFALVIIFAVALTWVYVALINRKDKKMRQA